MAPAGALAATAVLRAKPVTPVLPQNIHLGPAGGC